jgi:hypothetical protein
MLCLDDVERHTARHREAHLRDHRSRRVSERFAAMFLSKSLASTVGPARVEPGDRTTAIVIEVIDQTHLLAVLERLRDLSLEIERVNPAHEGSTNKT